MCYSFNSLIFSFHFYAYFYLSSLFQVLSRSFRLVSLASLFLSCREPLSTTAFRMSKKEKKRRVIDFSTYKFRHIAIKFAYFGWDYSGLAIQKDTINTVSEKLLIGLEKTQMIENRETCGLVCCGRTDKGVSAAGQVISLNVRSLLEKGIGFVEGSGVNITSRKGKFLIAIIKF